MNKLKFSSIFLSLFLVVSSSFAMEKGKRKIAKKSIVIAMDMDDVMSAKGDVKSQVAYAVLSKNPMLANTLAQLKGEIKKAEDEGINGTTNLTRIAAKRLEERGVGSWAAYAGPKLSDIIPEFVEASVEPQPIDAMVALVRKLKALGYVVVGATNQDAGQYEVYRRKMREKHGIDMDELFDAALVTRVHGETPDKAIEQEEFFVTPDRVYVAKSTQAVKPKKLYFNALAKMIQRVAPGSQKTVFTDDKKENVDGAQQAGLLAIHFDLPDESAKKTSPEDLQQTVNRWKQKLKTLDVVVE